jgi:cell division protease FtsH
MEVIDEEVTKFLHSAAQRANDLLVKNRDKLESLTRQLLAQEELTEEQITSLIGPSVHVSAESNGKSARHVEV